MYTINYSYLELQADLKIYMSYLEKNFLFRKESSLIHFNVALEEHSKASNHNSAASPVKTSTVMSKSNTILIQVKVKQMMYATWKTYK